MGEIASAMANGSLCRVCGIYLAEAVGYPRSCHDCRERHDLDQLDRELAGTDYDSASPAKTEEKTDG